MAYNGSGCIAMTGNNCVAIASDMRYGIQQQTIAEDFRRIYSINPHTYVALPGLATDVQTLISKFNYRNKLYELREERPMKPSIFSNMVSSMLYEKRFGPYFVEPIVAGLQKVDNTNASSSNNSNSMEIKSDSSNSKSEYVPYICAMDLIGAGVYTNDFLVGGTASEQLYGVCEAMYKPNMDQDQLFETISQCLLAAVDRDCLSGWGAVVYIITPDKVIERQLKSRKD